MRKSIRIRKISPFTNIVLLKPNELRIGNIIQDKENIPLRVTVDNIGYIMQEIHAYRPILISEEILISSGFKKDIPTNEYHLDNLLGYYFFFTGNIGMLYKADRGALGTPARYLHQLQNTWYILTGKEMEVKFST